MQALRICSDRRNHPVLFHCSSGKDRTGLLAALILHVCGLSTEQILDDYTVSEKFLQPVMDLIANEDRSKGLSSEFDGTPRYVMERTLKWITNLWGSVDNYLLFIGFGYAEQKKLRQVMRKESYRYGIKLPPTSPLVTASKQVSKQAELMNEDKWSGLSNLVKIDKDHLRLLQSYLQLIKDSANSRAVSSLSSSSSSSSSLSSSLDGAPAQEEAQEREKKIKEIERQQLLLLNLRAKQMEALKSRFYLNSWNLASHRQTSEAGAAGGLLERQRRKTFPCREVVSAPERPRALLCNSTRKRSGSALASPMGQDDDVDYWKEEDDDDEEEAEKTKTDKRVIDDRDNNNNNEEQRPCHMIQTNVQGDDGGDDFGRDDEDAVDDEVVVDDDGDGDGDDVISEMVSLPSEEDCAKFSFLFESEGKRDKTKSAGCKKEGEGEGDHPTNAGRSCVIEEMSTALECGATSHDHHHYSNDNNDHEGYGDGVWSSLRDVDGHSAGPFKIGRIKFSANAAAAASDLEWIENSYFYS